MTKAIKLTKGPFKGKTVTSAPQDRAVRLAPFIDRILAAVGHRDAYVTDESTLNDFALDWPRMSPYELLAISKRLGVVCSDGDERLVDLAERLMGGH